MLYFHVVAYVLIINCYCAFAQVIPQSTYFLTFSWLTFIKVYLSVLFVEYHTYIFHLLVMGPNTKVQYVVSFRQSYVKHASRMI